MEHKDSMAKIVILDTNECVSLLAEMARANREHDEFVTDVLYELYSRLYEKDKADILLWSFVQSVRSGKYMDIRNGSDVIESFYADQLGKIASTLHNQVLLYGMYNAAGKLNYEYEDQAHTQLSADIVLREIVLNKEDIDASF